MLRVRCRHGSTVCANNGQTSLLQRLLPEAPKLLGKQPTTDVDRNFFIFILSSNVRPVGFPDPILWTKKKVQNKGKKGEWGFNGRVSEGLGVFVST
jgi:hypothetical protein